MAGWLTPESIPSGTRVFTLPVPDDESWFAIVRGALVPLIYSANFEADGALSPEQVADRFAQMFIEMGEADAMLKMIYDTDDDGVVDGAESVAWTGVSGKPATFPPDPHVLLSTAHTDTLPASVVAGDLLIGDATPVWTRRAIGTNGYFLKIVAGLPDWQPIVVGDLSDLAAATMTMVALRLTSTTAISLSSTLHAFQTGLSTSTNLAISTTAIQGRSNGAASRITMQALGGDLIVGSNTATLNPFQAISGTAVAANFANTSASIPAIEIQTASAVTNTISGPVSINHNTSGTPAAGFGAQIRFRLESTTTTNQTVGNLKYLWADANHNTRSAIGRLTAYFVAVERAAIEWIADSVGSLITIAGDLTIQDKTNLTKQARFNLGGITAGQTRVVTLPDQNILLAAQDFINTFSVDQIFSAGVRLISLTASSVVVSDGSKNLVSSAVTATELGHVSGVTSAIQTQLDALSARLDVLEP